MEAGTEPTKIIGRYAIYRPIAAGGMASVHYGRLLGPVGFSRTVAIKRLHAQFAADPEFVSMFLDEARLATRIKSPHVVPTLDVVATDGELFLVMEYIPGEALSRLIKAAATGADRMHPNMVVAIMSQVLQGLHAAHEAKNERGEPLGIVHRDVSPQNILVGSDGQARVLDFGVAKAAGRMQTTRDGQLKGKLSYMPPEQLGGKELDRRSDVYAASVVLWEALTGERLFAGENEGATITRVLEGNAPAPSSVILARGALPEGYSKDALTKLDAVVLRGLSYEPADRFDSARDMAFALEECVQPASAAQVSAWVERIANSVLEERAEQVAEIESVSSAGVVVPKVGEVALKSNPIASEEPTVALASNPSNPVPEPPAQASGVSTPSAVVKAPRRSQRAALLLGAGTVLLLVVTIALMRSKPAQTAEPKASAAPPEPVPTAVVAAPPPSASALPSASTLPATSAELPKKAAPPRGPAPVPQKSCEPPYTWDAQGRKHYKPECL